MVFAAAIAKTGIVLNVSVCLSVCLCVLCVCVYQQTTKCSLDHQAKLILIKPSHGGIEG